MKTPFIDSIKTLIIVFLLIPFLSFSQEKEDPGNLDYFNKGLEYYNNQNLDSALIIWKDLVLRKMSYKYDTYGSAFFNIPTVYFYSEQLDSAEVWYQKIIASNLRDSDETGSLMEPHTNYKHKSAVALASIYEIKEEYESALKWLDLADTLYLYWGYEGSASNVNRNKLAILHRKINILKQLKRQDEIIQAILTEFICKWKYEMLFSEAEDYFFTVINKNKFKRELDVALKELKLQKVDDNNWTAVFELKGLLYQIPISNSRPSQNLPHYWSIIFIEENSNITKEDVVLMIKEKNFYQELLK